MSREKFEAWWVSENDGHQPRSSWSALRTDDGYNDEDIDLQWQGYQAATASMQAERDQLAAECAAYKEKVLDITFMDDESFFGSSKKAQIVMGDLVNIKTPGTERFLAEQRAQEAKRIYESILDNPAVVDMESLVDWLEQHAGDAKAFAAQLRNEVKV